jgi:hypothetical protein
MPTEAPSILRLQSRYSLMAPSSLTGCSVALPHLQHIRLSLLNLSRCYNNASIFCHFKLSVDFSILSSFL